MIVASIPAYLASWAEEISSRGNRVRQLIGDAHWLSDGMHKEFLVREFLRRHLPSELQIERGFIRSLAGESVSPEIDVLISVPRWHVPLFFEGGLQIVAPSSVLANLEVKSTYKKAVLKGALDNVIAVRKAAFAGDLRNDFWSGIFFVHGDENVSHADVVRDLQDLIPAACQAAGVGGEDARNLLPSTVCVMNTCIALLREEGAELHVTGFSAGLYGAALGFAQLFSFVRAAMTDQALPGELDSFLESIEGLEVKKTHVRV